MDELVREEPEEARYHEMRAAVRVDNKKFALALEDYDKALSSTPGALASVFWLHLAHGPVSCWLVYIDADASARRPTSQLLLEPLSVCSRYTLCQRHFQGRCIYDHPGLQITSPPEESLAKD